MPRTVDRLRVKWLWLKHSYEFRWAHKPLCSRFHSEVLKLGKLHVCRSCTLLYTGIVLSIPTLLLPKSTAFLIAFFVFYSLVIVGSYPGWYKKWSRGVRDVLRFLLGVVITANIILLFSHPYFMIPALAVMLICWRIYFVRRGKRRANICNGCPELGCEGVCSGYELQANRIRKYEEKATEILYLRSERLPDQLKPK